MDEEELQQLPAEQSTTITLTSDDLKSAAVPKFVLKAQADMKSMMGKLVDLYVEQSLHDNELLQQVVALETFNIALLFKQVQNAEKMIDYLMSHIKRKEDNLAASMDEDPFVDYNLFRTLMEMQLNTVHLQNTLASYIRSMPTNLTRISADLQAKQDDYSIAAGSSQQAIGNKGASGTLYDNTVADFDNKRILSIADKIIRDSKLELEKELDDENDLDALEQKALLGENLHDSTSVGITDDDDADVKHKRR